MSHTKDALVALILKLKQGAPIFNGEVFITTDSDYSEDGAFIATGRTMPYMYLEGPDYVRNPVFTTHQKPTERYGEIDPETNQGRQFRTFNAEEAVDHLYRAVIITDKIGTLSDAMEQVYSFLMNGKSIEVARCPEDETIGKNEYEIDLQEKFKSGTMVNRSNMREAEGTIIIRGVQMSDGGIFEEGYVANEVNLNTEKL